MPVIGSISASFNESKRDLSPAMPESGSSMEPEPSSTSQIVGVTRIVLTS
jgi:hypothetical protein